MPSSVENEKRPVNHNASPSANGWSFQYSAAICMFVRSCPRVKDISVENTEDVIIRRENENVIYGQAKSSLSADQIQNISHLETIKKALKSLGDNEAEHPSERLYVVFNFQKPFGELDNRQFSKYIEEFSATRTTSALQQELQDYCSINGVSIDLNKLYFLYIPFYDVDDKWQSVSSEIEKVLPPNLQSCTPLIRSILERYRCIMADNATNKNDFISYGYMRGVIIGECLKRELDFNTLAKTQKLDVDDDYVLATDVKYLFESLLDYYSDNYEYYSSELFRYYEYREANRLIGGSSAKQIAEYVCSLQDIDIPDFVNSVSERLDDEHRLSLYRLFVGYLLCKNANIRDIEEAFNYANQ